MLKGPRSGYDPNVVAFLHAGHLGLRRLLLTRTYQIVSFFRLNTQRVGHAIVLTNTRNVSSTASDL